MSTPVPPRAEPYDGLPPVALDFSAWLKFNKGINAQLRQLEHVYFRPRQNAVVAGIEPQSGRISPRKPR